MCGRYSFSAKSTQRLASTLGVDFSSLKPRYNIAPGQNNPVIYQPEKRPLLAAFKWGLVPHWLKEPQTKYSTINAKVETVAEKPFYRDSYRARRCLVPADGWYEWRKGESGKQPYYIHQRGEAFAFAGLWDRWRNGETLDSYTIITGPAAESVRDIHPRMPLVLPESAWEDWLDPDTPQQMLVEILAEPVTEWEAYPISKRVNSPKNEGPDLIAPQK